MWNFFSLIELFPSILNLISWGRQRNKGRSFVGDKYKIKSLKGVHRIRRAFIHYRSSKSTKLLYDNTISLKLGMRPRLPTTCKAVVVIYVG